MSLEAKTAVVTGLASEIGRAIAVCLAKEGAAVAIRDLDEKGISETAALIRAAGGATLVPGVDAANVDTIKSAAEARHIGPVQVSLAGCEALVRRENIV